MDEFYEEWDAIPVDIHESRRNSYPLLQSHLWQTASQMMRRCAHANIPCIFRARAMCGTLRHRTPPNSLKTHCM